MRVQRVIGSDAGGNPGERSVKLLTNQPFPYPEGCLLHGLEAKVRVPSKTYPQNLELILVEYMCSKTSVGAERLAS